MRYYELTYLVLPQASEGELKEIQEKITSYLGEKEGLLDNHSFPLKKKLAYPVRKENEAFLGFSTFQLNPEYLNGLDKILKAEDKILRFLFITKKPNLLRSERAEAARLRYPARRPELSKEKIEITPQEKKVELEEIGKKLEEILDEPK